jgi:integrase
MTRRGSGEGSIYQDGDFWVATVEAGRDPTTGRRLRRKVKARTKREVIAKAKQLREQTDAGIVAGAGAVTFGALLDRWLSTVVAARVSETTVESYRTVLLPMVRGLGNVPLSRLTPEHVENLLAAVAEQGFSRSYIRRMRGLAVQALAHATSRSLVVRNVAAMSIMPKTPTAVERQPYTPAQVADILAVARGHRLEALLLVGFHLGLRPGELTGLQWSDVDFDAGTLKVSGSMKKLVDGTLHRGDVKRSTAGVRTLSLPGGLLAVLTAHRKRQKAERLALGPLWHDEGLVFPNETGGAMHPATFQQSFRRITAKAGLDGFPYRMRHTFVSLLLDAGATISEVADLTGDDPATLYRHYRHRVREVATVAADRMPAILGSPVGSPNG